MHPNKIDCKMDFAYELDGLHSFCNLTMKINI